MGKRSSPELPGVVREVDGGGVEEGPDAAGVAARIGARSLAAPPRLHLAVLPADPELAQVGGREIRVCWPDLIRVAAAAAGRKGGGGLSQKGAAGSVRGFR